jgi:hypothetical protein
MKNRHRLFVIGCSILAALLVFSVGSIQAQIKAGFVSRLGTDTVAVERYSRSATKIEGDLVSPIPRTTITHYIATLDAKGTVVKFELSTRAPSAAPDAPPLLERTSTMSDSVVTTEVRRNGRRDTVNSGRTVVRPGAVPVVNNSNVFYEQMILQSRASKADSIPMDLFSAGPQGRLQSYVVRRGNNAYVVGWFNSLPQYVKTNDAGYIVSLDARETTVKVAVERVDDVDVEGIAKSFAAREASVGRPAGQLSPRDTARAAVGDAQLWIDYSKPMKRGRKIFGDVVVPWNQVWRTGANAATQFSTSKELKMGSTVVPAGKYTLWTLPTPSGTKLIINKQTGQWGTAYDEKQDFARLDIKTQSLTQSVEAFTIVIIPQGNGGEIRMDWDTTRFVIPFSIQ